MNDEDYYALTKSHRSSSCTGKKLLYKSKKIKKLELLHFYENDLIYITLEDDSSLIVYDMYGCYPVRTTISTNDELDYAKDKIIENITFESVSTHKDNHGEEMITFINIHTSDYTYQFNVHSSHNGFYTCGDFKIEERLNDV